MMIGLEIVDSHVTAVAVNDAGAVKARAQVSVAGDVSAAARSALRDVRGTSGTPVTVGVASPSPEAPDVVAAIASLRNDGAAVGPQATPSGSAAAFAESWIGAAKGIHEVVFFA